MVWCLRSVFNNSLCALAYGLLTFAIVLAHLRSIAMASSIAVVVGVLSIFMVYAAEWLETWYSSP